MDIKKKLISNVVSIVKEDKQNIFYLIYYSVIEAILLLFIPLATSFIINSILSHSTISIAVLGTIVVISFILTTLLQVAKQYIIEKFEQKIFVTTGIKIASMAMKMRASSENVKNLIDKHMNYFFDIGAIQKIFPILLLDGTALVVKLLFSLLLLFVFDITLFLVGLFFFVVFVILLFVLGRNGITYSIERSNTKHDAIYYLQNIPEMEGEEDSILKEFDEHLIRFVNARVKIFHVVMRQLTLTFIIEGLVFSSFLIIGGYLVINSTLPLGEFVAAEIIVVSITSALKDFMKQIDYIYDMTEGFYKVEKLSLTLQGDEHV
ncbi:ABC transporter ATP-binding protein [Sulfurimonas aquatica]|uniref:ABC transporter ATP-binding protein n=1 Tax=Sulfurimonas aquatica TaxID=2672570 RepID=A0A975AZP9_9BACT|nr:ABC transporter ATP-binding protein [Sulfurimonas aquatica]QSZ41534.1 ABC transporter ATP-binding protein [Sulfurimonas aquatica]